jgi:hydroxymethylpyrimidine pyrophosphatase-like HAD family hydrolase
MGGSSYRRAMSKPAAMSFSTTHPRFDAVICDIDGCLSPESSDPFDVAPLQRIAEHNRLAQERRDRPVLTVCSGRPQPFAEAMCRLLGNTTLPLIAENGVWMYVPGENIYEMDPAITRDHLRAVREAGDWLAEEFGPRGVSQQPGKSASVSLYHPDTAYLRSICPAIADEFARRRWPMRVSMTWLYINCDLKHVSKGTGIDRLLARTGLRADRVAGIGDTPSDQIMLEKLAWFGSPANAAPEIRERASFVAERTEAAGVVQILERLSCV